VPGLSIQVLETHLRRLTHLALLASLGVLALLPAFDHHAAEYSPWHSHLADDGRMAADLPWHHAHPFAQPHLHTFVSGADASAWTGGLIFAPGSLPALFSLLTALDQVLPPHAWLPALALAALWLLRGSPRLFPRLAVALRLDPPPRFRLG